MTPDYTSSEMMIVAASRTLRGARTVFVGVGLPNIACNLARHTIAPDLELIYESGVYGAQPARLPLSIGDPTLVTGALSVIPMGDLFGYYLQGGWVGAALLGGAQIDRHGNLNTTVIGEYDSPKVRLPGSGGACEIAINARSTLIIMRLSQRAFVERLDFLTSPGYLEGGTSRAGRYMPGAGPMQVITDKALFSFFNDDREMQIDALYPGVSIDEVTAEIGWPIRQHESIFEVDPPTDDEIRIIRTILDPEGTVTGRLA
ncbi:MAG: CoA-transferase subunit beta [Anaerolineae bacterium]|nr:CoA-transferase subunit beta [Anaerolineae bacterium]